MKKNIPEPGFYYHYKHDPNGSVNNYAYEVLGIGHHTEDSCRPEDEYLVVYRPLYEAFVYIRQKCLMCDHMICGLEILKKKENLFQGLQKLLIQKLLKNYDESNQRCIQKHIRDSKDIKENWGQIY
jgi:hypothetical protein